MNMTHDDVIDGKFALYNDYDARSDDLPKVTSLEMEEFFRIIIVCVLRIGYLLVQMGSIPVENVYVILYHNIIEIATSTVSFGTLGIMISYGFSYRKSRYSYWGNWNQFIAARAALGTSAVLTGTAQMSTFLVGRIHLGGALLVTALYCGIFQPFIMFLVWSNIGFMSSLDSRMRDPGFTLTAYIPSTLVGLVGALFLGRRLIKIKDVDEFSFGNEHVMATVIGYILIILGYCTLSLPVEADERPPHFTETSERVAMNNLLAFGTGTITVSLLYYIAYKEIYKYWIIIKCMQGGIAGMMTISAATDFSGLWNIFVMGALGSGLFFCLSLVLHNTALEDWCNMASSHLVCCVLGAMLWPLFEGAFGIFIWQILYTLLILVFTTIFALGIFFILNWAGILRNKHEVVHHKHAMSVLTTLPKKGYLERLFMIDEINTPHIVPGSYRKKFIPDDTHHAESKDGKTQTLKDSKGKDLPKKKERPVDLEGGSKVLDNDKKFLFPLSSPEPLRTWLTTGSGDYYDAMI